MSFEERVAQLIEKDLAFMANDWQPDPSVTDGVMAGYRHCGKKPAILCNDVFFWGSADAEFIDEATLPDFERAVTECGGDEETGALLYCARKRQERPQGALYKYIPPEYWALFDACGPEREIGLGNPYRPGEY